MAALAFSTCPGAVDFSVSVFGRELVTVDAMGLFELRVIAMRMTDRANRLDVLVMFGGVAEEMVILVPPLSLGPDVPAIGARKLVRMRDMTLPNFGRDTLARLYLVTIAGRVARRAGRISFHRQALKRNVVV